MFGYHCSPVFRVGNVYPRWRPRKHCVFPAFPRSPDFFSQTHLGITEIRWR